MGRYLETGVCLSAYRTATAVIVRFEVSAQQRVYTPQYDLSHQNQVTNALPLKIDVDVYPNEGRKCVVFF
jgi:hypothetical protein